MNDSLQEIWLQSLFEQDEELMQLAKGQIEAIREMQENKKMENDDCRFPLEVFPDTIREIIEALHEYENFNLDFTAASFFTVFAAAMGNSWSVRFNTSWVSRPIIYMVLVGAPSCGKTPPLQLAVTPLLEIDKEYDEEYSKEMKEYQKWERITPKQREKLGLSDDREIPKRKCHVVVDTTIEALIMALRDNPRGVLMYKDEIDSLLSNFNRYNGSDESHFLSLFSGTAFKYSRKSNNEHVFLSNPYCSIIGTTQPGRLAEQFGGKRLLSGFSSRFLKVYPEIADMPSWSDKTMPANVMKDWNRIIRKVVSFSNPPQPEGKEFSTEPLFSSEARGKLIEWKTYTNNKAYASSDSEAGKALCGKLETYIIRFALVIQIMRGICGEAEMKEIDTVSAERAVRLIEYFREMESRIQPELSGEELTGRYAALLSSLEDEFTTGDAVEIGRILGIPERSVKRFLSEDGRDFFDKTGHGKYRKK